LQVLVSHKAKVQTAVRKMLSVQLKAIARWQMSGNNKVLHMDVQIKKDGNSNQRKHHCKRKWRLLESQKSSQRDLCDKGAAQRNTDPKKNAVSENNSGRKFI
jgi:hypothetical protein